MIEIKHLSKELDGSLILDDISFLIRDSSFFGIIGESGAGKSTLLKCLNRLAYFDQGEIIIDGEKLSEMTDSDLRKLRRNMGMVFQHFGLLEQKSVQANIALPMEIWQHDKVETTERVLEVAELVGIEDQLNKRPKELSGGQKQRVAIARALVTSPDYLLCDECTSALDPRNSKMIMDLLEKIREELAVSIILVTHDMKIAEAYCSEIALLDKGHLIAVDRTDEIVMEFPELFASFMGGGLGC